MRIDSGFVLHMSFDEYQALLKLFGSVSRTSLREKGLTVKQCDLILAMYCRMAEESSVT